MVQNGHGEDWLNGVKVVEYERFSPGFRAAVAASKFHGQAGFGEASAGLILMQDHGFPVSFRDVKIRKLASTAAGR